MEPMAQRLKPQQILLNAGVGTVELNLVNKEILNDDGHAVWGLSDFDALKIKVYVGQKATEEQIRHTVLHELVHLALFMSGLDEDEDIPVKLNNEFITKTISNQLMILINLNPIILELIEP